MFRIVDKKILNDSVTALTVKAPFIAAKAKAGQFLIVRADERGERIPLTISDFNRADGTVKIVIQAVGFTTKNLPR